jgi:hypothetical protein
VDRDFGAALDTPNLGLHFGIGHVDRFRNREGVAVDDLRLLALGEDEAMFNGVIKAKIASHFVSY